MRSSCCTVSCNSQRGAALVFVTFFILPILFLLFNLSTDLQVYFSAQHKIQKVLDDAALHGYQYLPYQDDAQGAVRSYLDAFSMGTGVQTTVTSDSLQLIYRSTYPLAFPNMFGLNVSLPLNAQAIVWGAPYDVFVALDAGGNVAPAVDLGDGRGPPPVSRFGLPGHDFWTGALEFYKPIRPPHWYQVHSDTLSQQCFNPVFAALKHTAIATVEYLSAFQLNAVGIGVFPGSSARYLDVIRELRQRGEFGVRSFSDADNNSYVRSAECLAAAEDEPPSRAPEFRVPAGAPLVHHDPSAGNGRPARLTRRLGDSWVVDPDDLRFMRPREAIWGQVARNGRGIDTPRLMEELFAQVIVPPLINERGAQRSRTLRSAIIISSDLPTTSMAGEPGTRFDGSNNAIKRQLSQLFDGFRDMLSGANGNPPINEHVKFYYVIVPPFGGAPQPNYRALAQFFESKSYEEANSSFRIVVLSDTSLARLQDQIAAALALDRKGANVAR